MRTLEQALETADSFRHIYPHFESFEIGSVMEDMVILANEIIRLNVVLNGIFSQIQEWSEIDRRVLNGRKKTLLDRRDGRDNSGNVQQV